MNTRECTLLKKEKSNNYECSGPQKNAKWRYMTDCERHEGNI